ncbi:penicillin-binding protein 2, partial [Paenibacillus sepulcri]|nr:penicillin-binding protein 2 [Paenibacillus sepulcri]
MSLHADPPVKKNMSRRHFALRLNLFFFASFILFAILIIQLAVLQFVRSPALQEEESKSGQRDIEIPPARGNILDSSGQPIAYSISSQSLYFSIQPGFKEEDAEALAARLSEAFAEYGSKEEPAMTSGDIIRQMDLGHSRNSYTVPRRIKSGLSQGEIAYFSENRDLYQGIDIVEESVRHYDQSTIAVQLVGYLKKYKGVRESVDKYKQKQEETDPALQLLDDEDVGMDGLEYMYQDQLRGKNGLKTYPVDASSLIIGPPKITKPVRGDDIYLTINRNVQLSTEQAITDQLKTLQTAASSPLNEGKNAKTGYAVAMEVNTGKIVAMASMPDYNPNVWAGGKISEEDLKNIEYYQYNGTIRQVYAPYDSKKERDRHPPSLVYLGSTQKPLSVMIGLQEGLFTTGSVYSDTGVYYFGKKGHEVPIHNSDNHAYGQLHPYQAIAKSSNTFMSAMVGDRLLDKYGAKSVDVWDSYMKQFGLGVSTESGLPGESAGVIDYYHEAEAASRQSALVRASFG